MDPALVLLVAIPGVVLLFTAMSWLLSLGGWRRLARDHRTTAPMPPAHRWAVGFARVGLTSYSNVLCVGWSDAGLHLSMFPLFPFHPPVLVPWSAFMGRRRVRPMFLELEALEVQGSAGPVELSLRRRLTAEFEARLRPLAS